MEHEDDLEERKPGVVARLHAALLGENVLRDLALRDLSRTGTGVAAILTAVILLRYDAVTAIPFALAAVATFMWMWAEHRLHANRQHEVARAHAAHQILEVALTQFGSGREPKEKEVER